ncbi:MAG: phosphonate ABC transporter, permease protein PhnE [Anaerolineae bacterium]|nr:phosphonate ABC transporter, permease protein PhnE [Anaerolineales bacterium]MCO5180016.1 phosphonate ABC transporter, permease protein PhnE [Promineifilum sp.]MCW5845795.1 phosphonate ABC transporter, permease protein PhnE [Anaerolineae bacterium]
MTPETRPTTNPWLPAALSLIIPGGGQFILNHKSRGFVLFLTFFLLLALILWTQAYALLVPLALLLLWIARDAYQLARGSQPGWGTSLLLIGIVLYGAAIIVTEVRPTRLVTGLPNVQPYLRSLLNPELFENPTEDFVGVAPIMVPCVEPLPPPDREASTNPVLILSTPCTEVGDLLQVTGEGFKPNESGQMQWVDPLGMPRRATIDGEVVFFEADDNGRFEVTLRVPQAVPLTAQPAPGQTLTHAVRAVQSIPSGRLQPTQTLSLVIEKIGETIALAFLATVMGVVFAVPVSFLAARNLMGANAVTIAIYNVVRAILNIIRSIETLLWAIIFVVWVGLGPFAGTLALWLHTVAALAKLYSEAIESIDPGPIEAVRATGANWPQMVIYAVLPQILPTFTSFTLYRFDINVRLSTVIGLVSDAGLGFLVIQWVRLNRFSAMATAIIAIIIVVAVLDFASSWLRERIIQGKPIIGTKNPALRSLITGLIVIGFAAAFVWSWRVARIEPVELIRGAPQGVALAKEFATPELFTRPTATTAISAPLVVPCGATEPAAPADPGITLSVACGEPGDPLVISGTDLPPNRTVSVRWVLPGGAFLRIRSNCCDTDSDGNLIVETTINPIVVVGDDQTAPARVEITYEDVAGRVQLSDTVKTVVELSAVTLLMALIATTLGALFAIPLSFLAARNIMGDSPLGKAVYYALRTTFNVTRSIEPLILVLIAATWVGAGPFAGVLALALNNIPNLGKLFSESIEEINPGPVEAVTASGATRMQSLVYAVAPQLVPPFLAFIIYQWDINIRMSTVIGFVGGGGIGQQFRIWVSLNQYGAAGTAIWAIVIMVWTMDYLSAKARENLV